MGNFDNYYIDGNGNAHRDIPLGTSPADAYVRTNMKLKKEVQRIDAALQDTNKHIDTEISRVDETVVNAADGASRQLESAFNNINQNIDEVTANISLRITTEAEEINSRVDNIITHNNDTEGNSELIDIRTGRNGRVYSSAGTAIRNQMGEIQDALVYLEPTNQFNPETIIENAFINEYGSTTTYQGIFTSDFIPCTGGQIFRFARKSGNSFYYSDANVSSFAQYDSNKTFISGTKQTYANNVTLESNTKYVRFSNPMSMMQSEGALLCVMFDTVPTADNISAYFEPYYSVITPEIAQIIDDVNDNADDISALSNEVDSQANDIEELKKMVILAEPENKLNMSAIAENTLIAAGTETYNDTCFTTDFIKASAGDTVTFVVIQNGTFYHTATKMIRVSMYNSAKEFIESSSMFIQDYVIETENTAYIRVSVPNMALTADIASITLNSIPTAESISEYFTPYYSVHGVSDETKKSRRVLWLGTSIPTYGYPQILGRLCGATIINNSIGSSCIAKGINSNITTANICGIQNKYGLYSLCQTVQEKQAMIDNWNTIASELGTSDTLSNSEKSIALSSSYETELDPYLTGDDAVNLIVINHAYNDSAAQENALIADDPFDTHTLEGAYNWIIRRIVQANPNIGIVIFGHYTDLPEHKETALSRVAERWNIPYYQLKNDLGWSNEVITTTKKIDSNGEWTTIESTQMTIKNMWCADNIHPIGAASTKIAYVAQPVFEQWLKMYCT